jgi:branched-subunit amino acid transport protein
VIRLVTVLLIAGGTYALRALTPRIVPRGESDAGWRRFLAGVPAATAAALLLPGAFTGPGIPPLFVVAGLAAAALGAWWTRALWVAVLAAAMTMFVLLLWAR